MPYGFFFSGVAEVAVAAGGSPYKANRADFLVLGLPRSRTAWLANFLSHGRVACGHELLADCLTPDALVPRIRALGGSVNGSAETAGALFIERLLRESPALRVVVVRRCKLAVADSLARLGLDAGSGVLDLLDEKLSAAAAHAGALCVEFTDLDSIDHLRAIWEHCAPGEPFDSGRAKRLIDLNVQITARRWRELFHKVRSFWQAEGAAA
jgi:hypothetical protein